MFCPFCSHEESIVKDSRVLEDGNSIRRRRECPNCESRFTTYEKVHFKELYVIKKSGEKEFFDSEKLSRSIKMAIRKRDINADEIDRIINQIYQKLFLLSDEKITSNYIGKLIMKHLKEIDKVAYVRFASVYKNFNKAQDFKDFIKELV